MLWQPSLPDRYLTMSDAELAGAIRTRRDELGDQLLILGHHYQRDDVIQHADLTGDSLKLSQLAANEAARRGTKWIIFCGVHFMAETADILTDETVAVILPDISAGCSMADMADYDDVLTAWEQIGSALAEAPRPTRIVPITYVNSTAAVKAFVGEHGGACCTSSNAHHVFRWALAGGTQPASDDEDIKIIFLPDQHLGRNTASAHGFTTEVDAPRKGAPAQTVLYNPRKQFGGMEIDDLHRAKVILWAGHCSVHKLFRPEHVDEVRAEYANRGGINILVHPECNKEVVDKAEYTGSTEFIIQTVRNAEPGTNWALGTEHHLVNRLAREAERHGVHARILGRCQCLCTTMYRIDQPHLLWALDQLAQGKIVNQVRVHPRAAELARLALDRMLALVGESSTMPAHVD
jgi:quinolinate synthase